MLTKTTKIVVKDYTITLDTPLRFYKEDSLLLYFKIEEFGLVVQDSGATTYSTAPLFPERAFLFVETPDNTDSIEAVTIDGNSVCFELTAKYTINLGKSRMQIVLLDEESRKALPPFEFEVQPIIYDGDLEQVEPLYDGLSSEDNIALLSERGMLLDSSDPIYGIKISALNETTTFDGYIPIVQEGATKKISSTSIMSAMDEKFAYTNPISETITDYKSALDYLLYYDLVISLSSNQSQTVLEMGSVITSITFTWSYNKNILSQIFNGIPLNSSLRSYTYTTELSSNKTFNLVATDERKSFSKSISFYFRYGRYWGVSTSPTLDSRGILGLSKELSTGKGKTFTVNADTNQYIYYCYPSSWGTSTFSVGGFVGGFELLGTIDFTNVKGNTTSYYVYRSSNHSLGNTTVTVS
jgi:hypothetical protein